MNRAKERLMYIKKLNDENNNDSTSGGFDIEIADIIDGIIVDATTILDIAEKNNSRYAEYIFKLLFSIEAYNMIAECLNKAGYGLYSCNQEMINFGETASQCIENIKDLESLNINSIADIYEVMNEVAACPCDKETLQQIGKVYSYLVEYLKTIVINGSRFEMNYKEIMVLVDHYFEYFKINVNDVEKYITNNVLPSIDIKLMLKDEFYIAFDEIINELEEIDLSAFSLDEPHTVSEEVVWDEDVYDAYDEMIADENFEGFELV